MSDLVDLVRAARTPSEAIIRLATAVEVALDEMRERIEELGLADDGWGEWEADPEPVESNAERGETEAEFEARMERQHQEALERMNNTDQGALTTLPPTDEKKEQRRMFERQQLRLQEMLESLGQLPETDVDWTEVYATGGPFWLYSMNRELFMSYDIQVRQRMVTDIEEDDPQLAYQVALDALKQPAGEPDFENGSGALAVATVGVPKRGA